MSLITPTDRLSLWSYYSIYPLISFCIRPWRQWACTCLRPGAGPCFSIQYLGSHCSKFPEPFYTSGIDSMLSDNYLYVRYPAGPISIYRSGAPVYERICTCCQDLDVFVKPPSFALRGNTSLGSIYFLLVLTETWMRHPHFCASRPHRAWRSHLFRHIDRNLQLSIYSLSSWRKTAATVGSQRWHLSYFQSLSFCYYASSFV